MIPHCNRQHRLGAVSILLVERPIDRILDVRRQEVGIVDDQRLAGTGDITGDAGVVDGNSELIERNLGTRMILCELEPQHLAAVLRRFHQIQAARVRRCDTPRLREDQRLQGVVVPLGIERHTDAGQFVQLVTARFGTVTQALILGSGGRVAKRRPERYQEFPRLVRGRDHPAEQMVGDLVTSPRQGHNCSAGVDKRPQARNRTQLLRRGIQQEDGRSFSDREIVRRVHRRRFDALRRERTCD